MVRVLSLYCRQCFWDTSIADHYNCHLNIDGRVDASDWLTSNSLDSKRSHLCGCTWARARMTICHRRDNGSELPDSLLLSSPVGRGESPGLLIYRVSLLKGFDTHSHCRNQRVCTVFWKHRWKRTIKVTFLSVLPCESLKTYWLIVVKEGSKIEAVSFTVGSG